MIFMTMAHTLEMTTNIAWNDLKKTSIIDCGTFGDVYKAIWKTKDGPKNIAIKVFRGNLQDGNVLKEIAHLSLVKHANIVTLYGSTKDSYNRIIMLMEYAECGSLSNILHNRILDHPNVTYDHKISWMLQCAKGLAYLHCLSPKILHRDIKSPNLLLFNQFRTLKICDFGTVKELATEMTLGVGTVSYMAPEVCDTKSYTEKCDVYSFGITLWEVMSERKPFYHIGQSDVNIKMNIICGERPHVTDIPCFPNSDQVINLIMQCWNTNSASRPSMQQVIKILETFYEKFQTNSMTSSDTKYEIQYLKFQVPETSKIEHIFLEMPVIALGKFYDINRAKWKTEDGDKTIVAKSYRDISSCCKHPEKEIKHLSAVQHENILKLYGIAKDDLRKTVILEEYADCGSLDTYLHENEFNHYTYSDALKWMLQIAEGMTFLHNNNIIHRDLNPSKLLLMNGYKTLKICNSHLLTELNTLTKNSAYISPEVRSRNRYTKMGDVYSFGIILWEVMSRKKPLSNIFTPRYITSHGIRPDLNDAKIFMDCDVIKEFMTMCWNCNPEERPTMNELKLYFCDIVAQCT